MNRRTLFRALAAIACAALPLAAPAQAWPERPIKFLMTAPAGSSIDLIGRTIADKLGPRLGQPVVVELAPGPEAGDGTAVRVEDVFAGLKVVSGMGHVCLRRCGERGLIINEWGGCGRAARFWRVARSWRKSVCGYILKEGRVKRNDKEAMRGEFK